MSETRTTAAAADAAPRSTEEVAAATGEHPEEPGSPSLAKGLFLGELHQDLATRVQGDPPVRQSRAEGST